MRYVIIFLLLYSCQVDTGFKDLTLDNGFNPTFFFNSPQFTDALDNVGKAEVDTVFSIKRPEYLLPPPLNSTERGWITTDTFAFETGDFQKVVNVIVQTAESHRDSIKSSLVSADLAEVSLNGHVAYSAPGTYYLVPFDISTGERIYIQVTRTKSAGEGSWSTWYYSANGLWMIGEDIIIAPGEDAS